MAYIASLQKEVLSINNLFREHLKSFGFEETKSLAQCVGLFYVFGLWYSGIRPFPALVPFLIVCKERNERCFALQNESACLN